jgi:hypothetical protein
VGESNTFVHNGFGYVRSTILPIGCNLTPEQKYQFLLRNCFLLDRFKGLNKTNITKFIISNISGIEAAEIYESINDDLVQDLINNPNKEDEADDEDDNSVIEDANNTEVVETVRVPGKTTIIPVQYKIEDFDSDNIKRLQDIMRKDKRTHIEKDEFTQLILDSIEEEAISVTDNNNPKINLADYTLGPFRCYKETSKSEYRFKLLHDNLMLKSPVYINGGEYTPGECSFYGCLKRHVSEGHTNYPHTFYLTFAN